MALLSRLTRADDRRGMTVSRPEFPDGRRRLVPAFRSTVRTALFNSRPTRFRRHTSRRLANLLKNRIEMRHGTDRLRSMPWQIIIDVTNHCSLRCPLCPTGQGRRARPRGYMSLDAYRCLIDELGPTAYELYLYNWGDPMLHPDLVPMIEYAHRAGLFTAVSTSLNVLREPTTSARLTASGLDRLTVSLDGATAGTYTVYRRGGDFERVLANIRDVAAARNGTGPFIEIQFIPMRQNETEIETAETLAHELGADQFTMLPMRVDMAHETDRPIAQLISDARRWMPTDPDLCRYDLDTQSRRIVKTTCIRPWSATVINWDGAVSPCCSVYDPKDDFGNAFADGFAAVWNGPDYRSARRTISDRRPGTPRVVCANCLTLGFPE